MKEEYRMQKETLTNKEHMQIKIKNIESTITKNQWTQPKILDEGKDLEVELKQHIYGLTINQQNGGGKTI